MTGVRTACVRRLVLTAILGAVGVGATGCAPAYSASGQLAQSASDGSAQTRTGALTLRLAASQRVPSPATDTALSDAIDKLEQDDSSVTSADVSGTLDGARRRILDRLRASEDLLIHARLLVDAQAGSTEMDAVVRQLQAVAKQLTALEKQLQGSG